MKNQAKEMIESQKPKRGAKLLVNPIPSEPGRLTFASSLTTDGKKSWVSWIFDLVKGFFKQDDLNFEQWERLERKYSPLSSHHGQIYYRDRG